METLRERFDVLQDQLMNIYEVASDTLEAQIEHWRLLRKEAVLLYYARQNGVLRLGYQPVPPLATSEAKAKEAIGMMLQLQSLQKSAYASEKWTLVDTSIETFKNTPENHFKKGPVNVEVIYDGDPDNANLYTMWRYVYYLDSEDRWQKTESGANHTGIYYTIQDFKHYYILFADDAKKYGKSGQWEVRINKETVFAPVTSSTPPESPGRERPSPESTAHTKTTARSSASPDHELPQQTSDETNRKRRYGRRESSPTESKRQRRRSSSRQKKQGRRSRSRTTSSQSRSRSRSSSSRGSRGSRGRTPRGRGKYTTRGRGRGSGRKGDRRGRRSRRSSSSSSPTICTRSASQTRSKQSKCVRDGGISPGDVGRSVQTVSRRNTGRLGRLLEEARDPPVILLRGDANTVKCFRNRAKQKYKGLCKAFSTTWSWVAADGTERLGRSRVLVSFTSHTQRSSFLKVVKFPKGVDWSLGNLDKL